MAQEKASGTRSGRALGYFAVLGVSEDVSQEELEARYRELADYLSSAAIPAHLREWARRQADLVDEAYAVLADPERRAAARQEGPPAPEAQAQPSARAGGGERESGEAREPAAEFQEEAPEKAQRRPRAQGVSRRAAGLPERPAVGALDRLLVLRSQPLVLGLLIGLVVLGAILLGRYGFPSGGEGEVAQPEEQADVAVPLDQERVAELMAVVEENPNDAEALFELGEIFFQANEWSAAIEWFTRLLALEPNNTHARTDVGTANFNLGRPEEAKAAWLAVLEIDPNDVQVHYNLGFLYANTEPRDLASARREWQKVVDLAPDSNLAKTAQVHLDGLLEETEEGTPPP